MLEKYFIITFIADGSKTGGSQPSERPGGSGGPSHKDGNHTVYEPAGPRQKAPGRISPEGNTGGSATPNPSSPATPKNL